MNITRKSLYLSRFIEGELSPIAICAQPVSERGKQRFGGFEFVNPLVDYGFEYFAKVGLLRSIFAIHVLSFRLLFLC